MTIKVYSGLTGSGKTYNSVSNVILPALEQGRTVVTNVVLKKTVIFERYPDANLITIPFGLDRQSVERYINAKCYPPGSVFVLDEGARLFPSGWKQTQVPTTVLTFFTEHRHSVGVDGYSSEIFIICQDSSQLAKWVRDLVDSTYCHEKLDKHGAGNTFRVDIYDRCVSSDRPIRDRFIQSLLGTYKQDVIECYESYTSKASGQDRALEKSPDDRASFKRVYVKLFGSAAVLIVLGIVFGIQSFNGMLRKDEPKAPAPIPAPVQPSIPETPGSSREQSIPDSPARPQRIAFPLKGYRQPTFTAFPESPDWRLTGVILGTANRALLSNKTRTISLSLPDNCYLDSQLNDWVCFLHGHVVAAHTGPEFDYQDPVSELLPFAE